MQRVVWLCNRPSGYAYGQGLDIRAEHIYICSSSDLVCMIRLLMVKIRREALANQLPPLDSYSRTLLKWTPLTHETKDFVLYSEMSLAQELVADHDPPPILMKRD